MAEPQDGIKLLDELKGGAWEAALCTTYNVSSPFFEEVILRRLRGSGCRHIVVLADAARVAEELASVARRPSYAGDVYTLAPMPAAAAFHPKVLLLVGPKRARLYVGSHNLTYAGFTANLEATGRVDVAGKDDRTGQALLADVLQWIERVTAEQPPAIRDAIRAFSAFTDARPGPAPIGDTFFVGTETTGPSLFERVRSRAPARVRRIVLTAPFLDGDLSFVETLQQTFKAPVVVGIDPAHVALDTSRARRLAKVDFVDARAALGRDTRLHAKAMLVEDAADAESVLVVGSANASAVAWLADGARGNVEAVIGRIGITSALDEHLGLRRLVEAAPLTEDVWAQVEQRQREAPPVTKEPTAVLGRALCIERRGASYVVQHSSIPGEVSAVDSVTGERVFPLPWSLDGPWLKVAVPAQPHQLLRVHHSHGMSWAVLHDTERLRELAEPSARRRLREALGSLGEVGTLEDALRAAEKVIFDDETVFRTRHTTVVGADAPAPADEMAAGSLAIPLAADERTEARRRRVARDDLALLLDAVLRALHRELPSTTRPEVVDAQRASDDDVEVPEPDDGATVEMRERLGALVRRKSKTMIARLSKIVEAAARDADADAARAVVRCVAVLGLLFALRRAEQKPAWRVHGIWLVDAGALESFGSRVLPLLLPTDGLLAKARAQGDAEAEEVVELPELVVWWAWTAGMAGPPHNDDEGAAEKAMAHARTIVARRSVVDEHGGATRFLERAGATPRAGVSARLWWDALSASSQALETLVPTLARRCFVGDLAAAGPKRRPGVVVGVRGSTVEIADLLDGAVIRKFKAESIQPVAWSAPSAAVASR